MQNAAKHATNSPVKVQLDEAEGWLAFSVHDEGPGFDVGTVTRGTGLHNMTDRLGALDGIFSIESTPGGPTAVSGRVPMRVASEGGASTTPRVRPACQVWGCQLY